VKLLRLLGLASEIGFTIAFCILLGIALGWWVDEKLGTKPLFIIAGLLLGLASAGYSLYRFLLMGKLVEGEKEQ